MNYMDWMNHSLLTLGSVNLTAKTMLLSLVILLVGLWLARRSRRTLLQRVAPAIGMDKSTAFTISTLLFYVVTAITVLVSFSILGFDVSNLAIVAGALSVGIGFGLQDIAKNFISGLLLLFDRSIKVGDYIQLSNSGLRGTVEQIRVRSTIVKTGDDLDVIVPNSQFLSDQVVNWTMSSDFLRLHVPLGVAYGSDVEKLKSVLLALAGTLPSVVQDDPKHPSRVWFTGMGESSLDFELLVWVQGDAVFNHRATLSEYTFAVHKAILENGFEIPFPQRDVHIRSMPESLQSTS
ncbi:MAG TPA: mechanosensitive ion channel domain-containing protein [Mariprofundaceae bacterium]|nr:mechanosensitive ion channel domain-containing protein [Mariprofundaceae bacterium]